MRREKYRRFLQYRMLTVRMHNPNLKPQDLKFYPQDLNLNRTSTHRLCSGNLKCQQVSQTRDSGG